MGAKGLVGYGMAFGVLISLVRGVGTQVSTRRVVRRAAEEKGPLAIEVAEKEEERAVIPYLENVPRTLMDKRTLDKLLTTVPRDQWEYPPEDSYLYTLKCYAEVYGEGKATKMGWWDYWYMKLNTPDSEDFMSGEEEAIWDQQLRYMSQGKVPLYIPGPAGL